MPAVPGLLQYRKDNKKLYVRSNETWKVIAPEKKVFDHDICVESESSEYFNSNFNIQNPHSYYINVDIYFF